MKISESGRSMVEMLGVLAVIGVLSIGGIAGYMMAMNRHHSNNVLEGVSARAVIISAQKMMGQPAAHPADMAEEIDDYAVAVVEEPGVCAECFGIEVSGIPQGVCRYILNQKWATPEGVYLNDDEYPTEDGTNCNEEGNEIAFVFSPSMGGESHTCGYCQHDENGTCVADETCDNGCPGDKPMKNSSGTCVSCSAFRLVTSAEECAKCSNRYLTSAGNCVLCNTRGSAAADASECARCPNRSMQDGLCVRDRCSDGYIQNGSACSTCDGASDDLVVTAEECAKCPNRRMQDGKCVRVSCTTSNKFYTTSSYGCQDCSANNGFTATESECAKCSDRMMFNGKCISTNCGTGIISYAGGCGSCNTESALLAPASECRKCSNRFLTSDGTCAPCHMAGSPAADGSECAKCPNRSMQDGKCVRDRCPDGQWMTSDGYCRGCGYISPATASASECAKCSNRFMGTDGKCHPCSSVKWVAADATECAKCSEREIQGEKCVLKECPSGTARLNNGSCV